MLTTATVLYCINTLRYVQIRGMTSQTFLDSTSSLVSRGLRKISENLPHRGFLPISSLFISQNGPNLKHSFHRGKLQMSCKVHQNGTRDSHLWSKMSTIFAIIGVFVQKISIYAAMNVKFGTTDVTKTLSHLMA